MIYKAKVGNYDYDGLEVELCRDGDTYDFFPRYYIVRARLLAWALFDDSIKNKPFLSFQQLTSEDLVRYPQIQQAIQQKEERDRVHALRQKNVFIPVNQALPHVGEKVVVGSNNMFFIVEYTGQSPWISPYGSVITCWYPIPQTLNNRPIEAPKYTDED